MMRSGEERIRLQIEASRSCTPEFLIAFVQSTSRDFLHALSDQSIVHLHLSETRTKIQVEITAEMITIDWQWTHIVSSFFCGSAS